MKQQREPEVFTLDDAVEAVRRDEPSAEAASAAAGRVWERVSARISGGSVNVDTIRGCSDVQALLAAHRRGELGSARALLVEDHLRECPACRAVLHQPGTPRLAILPWRPASPVSHPRVSHARRNAIAAAMVAALGLTAWGLGRALFSRPSGSRAAVQSVSGALHRLHAERALTLSPGETLAEGEAVRTGHLSRAVLRLFDGSTVEMGERAELKVSARGSETTIHLARGSIIVQAAPQRSGRLLVASNDCTVAVTGTVFSVNHGLKGSRVSVLEGHVRVSGGGQESLVAAGEQWATSAAVGAVPLRDEVAWSGDLDRHLALLAELQSLREKWKTVRTPGLRYESPLLARLPRETVVFAGLPNYGEALAEAHRVFEEQLQERPVLREWWQGVEDGRGDGPRLAELVEKVRGFAEYLGDEVVLAAFETGGRRGVAPVLLAQVRQPGLQQFLEREVSGLQGQKGPAIRFVTEGGSDDASLDRAHMFVLLRSDLMAVAADPVALQALARLPSAGAGLDRTPFGERIAEAYAGGVGLLFAADLERITAPATVRQGRRHSPPAEALRRAGLDTLRHLIVERKQVGDQAHTQAVLAFAGPARGIPSWLGAPSPMGSLDFVSPHAQGAVAFVSKSPSLVFDDIVAMASAGGPRPRQELAELESKLDLRIREDIAETLGGEFALALDGPLLPTPAWKLVVEVYDPVRLQEAIRTLVHRAHDEAARAGRPGLRLEAEQVGERTYHALHGGLPFEVHYAYDGGYLVMAPTRALVMKALRTRASGETLGRSAAFRALFPPDRDAHVSGLAYQNLAPLVGSLAQEPGMAPLSPDQRRALADLTREARPSLVCAYAEEGGIRVAGLGGVFDLGSADLALPMLLERAFTGTARRAAP